MNIDYALLGKRITQLRIKQGLTQEKLSEKAGITNNYLSNIERNRSIPSLETLMSICTALNTTPDTVLIGTDNTQPSYLMNDITSLLEKCTAQEKRIVISMIDVLIKNRD